LVKVDGVLVMNLQTPIIGDYKHLLNIL